jgi:hypothetical protein
LQGGIIWGRWCHVYMLSMCWAMCVHMFGHACMYRWLKWAMCSMCIGGQGPCVACVQVVFMCAPILCLYLVGYAQPLPNGPMNLLGLVHKKGASGGSKAKECEGGAWHECWIGLLVTRQWFLEVWMLLQHILKLTRWQLHTTHTHDTRMTMNN